jgi:transcriptional regulator with XRE-family HTH domain
MAAETQETLVSYPPVGAGVIGVPLAAQQRDSGVRLADIHPSYAPAMRIGELLVAERATRGVTREQLALRARIEEKLLEQIEAGDVDPDPELARRLGLGLGLELITDDEGTHATPLRGRYDPADLAAARARPMGLRLADAFSWNQFTSSLAGTARAPDQ